MPDLSVDSNGTQLLTIFIFMYTTALRILISEVKLATGVESDQKAPFSIATTPRCRGECYSFPWIAPLYP